MRRIAFLLLALILLTISACAPKPDTTAPKESAPEPAPTPEATQTPEPAATPTSNVLSTHYMDAAAALAANDLEKAKAALTALANESTGEMKTLAQTAANTGDIAATRDAFKALSKVATKMELPPDYAVASCPMYKGGAKWVQKKDKLANPYFGKTSDMATCGSFDN
jgi:hypothetical protein